MQTLRDAARRAICVNDELSEAWRNLPYADAPNVASRDDVPLLCELIKYRILPANAFGLLVRLDLEAAVEMLLRRYIGESVDPDRKFGGFQYELTCMLIDLVEVRGQSQLRSLLTHPEFNSQLFADDRLLTSISEAMDIDTDQARVWLESQGITYPERS
jgi:hypothetical protein